ncbi:hypothetical protein EJB05_10463, partial [Eragrostis curvula]
MRRFFFFGSSAVNAEEGTKTPSDDGRSKHRKKLEDRDGYESSGSCGTRTSRSRSRRGKLNDEELSKPKQLRRSMSFSSPARKSCLDERTLSFSGDVLPCSLYDESDVPQHTRDVDCHMWSQGNRVSREDATKVSKAYSATENDSPDSRCCSCSTGHSPVSSPIALRCRPTRLSNLVNKNDVVDRYIDAGQENSMLNEKQKQHSTYMVPTMGRPPRPQPAVPSGLKPMKDVPETYPDVGSNDVCLQRLIQELKIFMRIYKMCDLQMLFAPPHVLSGGQETDDELLQRVKEVESRFLLSSGTNMRKQLAHELSSQIKARVTERFAAREQYKQSKKALNTRTRRLEKEKSEVQINLEREMDRRSQDWSDRILKFQSEEERLHERVRELAEQNISFQREVTFLEANKADASAKVASLELQNKKLNDELEQLRCKHDDLHNSSADLHARFTEVTEERDHLRGYFKDKEDENRALHKVIARLQMTCNEQERTITSLRQGYRSELDKSIECSSDKMNKLQMELIRLTGVEQKLRGEVRSCHLEAESLRHENIALLNRLQSAGNGSSVSMIRLDQELQAIVDKLQTQGLSLFDKISQLCTKLMDLIKHERHENESPSYIDVLTVTDCTHEYQSIKGAIEALKRSLQTINSILSEKQNIKEKPGETAASDSPSREQKDNFGLKLKEEALLSRVLKEAVLSKELEIEQLQSDLASSLRIQDVMRNEIQRVHDEHSCITHKAKQLELQASKKAEAINQIQQDFQESAKELTALRGTLKTVTEERDLSWQEVKQLRRNVNIMQNEVVALKKKIESLDEDILVKEGQISILQDAMNKPFDIICSPRSLREFDME